MKAIEYQRMSAAEEQHWWYLGLQDLVLRWVRREAAHSVRPLDIMDAGCGTGRLCQLLQPFGTISGCDMHPLATDATLGRGIKQVLQCNLVTASLDAGCYDLITCMDVLYHRAVTDEAAVLRNLYRALRTGGLLLLHVPAFEALRGTHDAAVHTRRRYRREALSNLLAQTGFTVEFASYRLPLLFVPALLWRHHSRRHTADTAVRSDTAIALPAWLNRWLASSVRFENHLLAAGWRMPFGLSLFVCARKVEWQRRSASLPVVRQPQIKHELAAFLNQHQNFIPPPSAVVERVVPKESEHD